MAWFFTCPVCKHRYSYSGSVAPPPCPRCVVDEPKRPVLASDVERALERFAEFDTLIDNVLDNCESEDGNEFLTSVQAKALAIAQTIEQIGRVSEGQLKALANMERGAEAWMPHD